MHVTFDDVNFCDSLECVYVKYRSHALTACEMPDKYIGFLPVKTWLLIACDTAFYVITMIYASIFLSTDVM